MYHTLQIQVKQDDALYPYLERISHLTTNLYNAGMFRCRQLLSAAKKDPQNLTDNEKEVLAEYALAFPEKKRYSCSYPALEKVMRVNHNPDFFADGLSKQAAQNALKQVARDISNFFAAVKAYNESSKSFLSKPNIPGYHKKGGLSTVTFTNQDCCIQYLDDYHYLKLPLTKEKLRLGTTHFDGQLMEVKVKPFHNIFIVCLVLDDGKAAPETREEPKRICAIDFGVENFAAITNNVGLPCLLFKGGVLKSQNQWYNKRMAQIKSEQMKGTTNKFVPTPESQALCLIRENQVKDFSRKICKRIVNWCLENNIDTIVAGVNKNWKQSSNMGAKNNQEFVQLPFNRVIQMLELEATANGIRFVRQEESYTSKASYLDNDFIPVYGVNDNKASFSGKRKPTKYKGMYKKDGFRGLYVSSDGTIINSDLNGSANIGRKAFPELFSNVVDFTKVAIIKHPDYENKLENRKKQMLAPSHDELCKTRKISKSKALRLKMKAEKKSM